VYYPNFQMKGVNWQTEKTKYEPEALNANSWSQFFFVTNQMINDLRDGHSKLIGAPVPPVYTPLIATALWNGQVVVTWSNGNRKIPVGSIVTSVDGEPALTRLNSIKYSAAAAAQVALVTNLNQPEQLGLFVPSSNQDITVTAPVYPIDDPIPNNALTKMNQAYHSSWAVKPGIAYGKPIAKVDGAFRVAYLQNKIVYVYIPAMGAGSTMDYDELMKEFQSVLQLARSAKGIIIDIRGNYGGNMGPGLWFARHMYTRVEEPVEIRYPLSVYNQLPNNLGNDKQIIPLSPVSPSTQSDSFMNWGIMQLSPLKPTIHIPVALLTNDLNFSAAENFTAFMQAAPNVKTFGGTTGGSDGSPGTFPVMKDVQIEIPTWQERIIATGLPIEGFGLPPDYPVYISDKILTEEIIRSENGDIQQVMAHDPVLQAAQNWLGNNLK
jgi:hypothetical protein